MEHFCHTNTHHLKVSNTFSSADNHIRRDWCGGPQCTLLHSHKAVGSGVAVGLIVRIETLLAIVCHRIFMIILVEYRLGLLGIEMYHEFKRLLNHTKT